MSNLRVVNIVGSGAFDLELDLVALSNALGGRAEYEPEIYPAMYLRVCGQDGPLATIYRTGKFIIVGSDNEENLFYVKEEVVKAITEAIERPMKFEWFEIQNYVHKGDIGRELDLNALAIGLGLTKIEYEPEQFPGIIYRPDKYGCVILIFRSGKVVVTGTESKSDAETAYREIVEKIEELFE
jgi:transcription initiation factor TFIID TATA-box-binding protein